MALRQKILLPESALSRDHLASWNRQAARQTAAFQQAASLIRIRLLVRSAAFQSAAVDGDAAEQLAAVAKARFAKDSGIVQIPPAITNPDQGAFAICLRGEPAFAETIAAADQDIAVRSLEQAARVKCVVVRKCQAGGAGRLEGHARIKNVALAQNHSRRHECGKGIQHMVAVQHLHHRGDGQEPAGNTRSVSFFKEAVHAMEMSWGKRD
ncbi:hypothetical protein [Roseibium sediminicola]|uniref:Uncharacterized protein n=1 Tax=Roseibium sediminicola TaxID=2933272 RepID=A0ABT0H1B6_9HYPH|nr:hypothetical protein [Roseibium sp. CAU 1639]MCK7615464.1 hypothetical protein [Roseibium sp. CAU 1639]